MSILDIYGGLPMKKQDQPSQIQLELPDYSYEYEQYLRKEQEKKEKTPEERVIIIELYK